MDETIFNAKVDENFSEKAFDELIAFIRKEINSEANRKVEVNPEREEHVIFAYKVLKHLTKGTKAKVTYQLHDETFKGMGWVSVEANNLSFKHAGWFMRVVELASNMEVYPRTDGTVQMNFTFYGLTK